MTQPSRTTESINRDNAAIREIMLKARELTVPDRATLTLGLVGNLATMMNRSQMTKLLTQLQEEVERVQDVPPARQRELEERAASRDREDGRDSGPTGGREAAGGADSVQAGPGSSQPTSRAG